MNVFKFIKKAVLNACFYFTVAEFLLLIFHSLFLKSAVNYLSLAPTSLIFLACLILSLLNFIWRLEYSTAVKVIMHFIGALVAYILVFIIIPGYYTDVAKFLAGVAIFAILYLVCALIMLLVRSFRKARRTENLEYESQFGEFFNDN